MCHSRTFDTDRPLDGIKPRAGIDQPLHEPKVAAGYGRTGHEGFDNPFMACRSHTQQLFRLMKWLVNACPWLDAIKQLVYIEGARMAFT